MSRGFGSALLLITVLAGAVSAHAQDAAEPGPAARLGDPGDEPEVVIPEPPGAPGEDEEGVRYPIPDERAAHESAGEEEPTIRIPSRITTRMRALDASLRSLSSQGGGNVVNAVLSLITGGLSITLGAVKEPNDDWLSIYLYVYGGTAAARGALDLILAPHPSGVAITYQHMPMTSREEVAARLRFGESALRGLAEQALIARVLDASLNMAAGVAVVPIYLAPNDFEIASPLDYFVLIGAGVSIISGVITLLSTSAAEQRWSAYEDLARRLNEEHQEERSADDDVAMYESPAPSLQLSGLSLRLTF